MMRKNHVGIVDYNEGEEDEYERINCSMCEKLDIYPIPKLGPKLLLDGAKPQPDHENWLQCPSCAWICPIYEAKTEQFIDAFTQTSDNPFDDQKSQILSAAPRRNSKEGKKQLEKRMRERERQRPHHTDIDIDLEIQSHGSENVSIIEDSDP